MIEEPRMEASDEWQPVQSPPARYFEVYRVRVDGGREAWAFYIGREDWRGWNGKAMTEPIFPKLWRWPRDCELDDSGIESYHWRPASEAPSNGRNVWVLWADWTESLGCQFRDLGGWWRMGSSGQSEPFPVKAICWREYEGDDSGALVLSRELQKWVKENVVDF